MPYRAAKGCKCAAAGAKHVLCRPWSLIKSAVLDLENNQAGHGAALPPPLGIPAFVAAVPMEKYAHAASQDTDKECVCTSMCCLVLHVAAGNMKKT